MATDSIVTLEKLRCIRESDGSGHSEPYLWPFLLYVDDTLTVGVQTPALGNARIVIKGNMKANDIADIPVSVGRLPFRFTDFSKIRALILVVALMENDETPTDAIMAGFQAFTTELRSVLVENLLALNSATGDDLAQLIKTISARVNDKVTSAIKDKSSIFDIFKNQDDTVGNAFLTFRRSESNGIITPIQPQSFTMRFENPDNIYEVQAKLTVQAVPIDLCQAQVNAVRGAQSTVDGIQSQIAALQEELKHAAGTAKAAIIAEIRTVRQEELKPANNALAAAQQALATCRSRNEHLPPVVTGGGVLHA